MNEIDTDCVRFEHDECDNEAIVSELCAEIDRLRFLLAIQGWSE